MKSTLSLTSLFGPLLFPLFAGLLLATVPATQGSNDNITIDDFSDVSRQASGLPRMLINDAEAGGKSQAVTSFTEGVMTVEGKLVPGRGSPGFVSIPLVLSSDGTATDVSQYTGVKLRVKLQRGSLIVQASSTDVTNFDYHSSAPITRDPDAFQEVLIPFAALRQVWSAQTTLNLKSITSINLVSAGMAPDAIAYEIDEIGFY